MNKVLEEIALRKQVLQARSTLYRLEIQSGWQSLGETLPWLGIGAKRPAAASFGSWAISWVLRRLGGVGVGQGLALASGALLFVKLVRLGLSLLRKPSSAAGEPSPSAGEP